jgi:uncharacterized membrane protein YhhN
MPPCCKGFITLIAEATFPGIAFAPVALSCIAVSALVWSDRQQLRGGRYLFKPLAAAAFIWLALVLNATGSGYGNWLLGGLILCALGDLFLMADNERLFLAGLGAFLCGHLLYAVAFLVLSANVAGLAINAVPAVLLLVLSLRWLYPHLQKDMQVPVALYTLVITAMLLCAGLSAGHPAALLILSGTWGFAISDLAVARQQFVQTSPLNGLWGTPLYFLSQMLLAASLIYA